VCGCHQRRYFCFGAALERRLLFMSIADNAIL